MDGRVRGVRPWEVTNMEAHGSGGDIGQWEGGDWIGED